MRLPITINQAFFHVWLSGEADDSQTRCTEDNPAIFGTFSERVGAAYSPSERAEYLAGQTIFELGDAAASYLFILDGEVGVYLDDADSTAALAL